MGFSQVAAKVVAFDVPKGITGSTKSCTSAMGPEADPSAKFVRPCEIAVLQLAQREQACMKLACALRLTAAC